MKQKDLKKEIFIHLQNSPLHQRELARILSTNQTSIRRALNSLQNQNIIDFNKIGKNSQYFIKNSLESEICNQEIELYKLKKIVENPKIRKIIQQIHEKIKNKKIPENTQIILFGSYAKKLQKPNSDIDIYTPVESKKIKQELEEISSKISLKQGKLSNDSLSKEIKKYHIILNGPRNLSNK